MTHVPTEEQGPQGQGPVHLLIAAIPVPSTGCGRNSATCAPFMHSLQRSASVTCTQHGFRDSTETLASFSQAILPGPGSQVWLQDLTATGRNWTSFQKLARDQAFSIQEEVKNYFLSLTKTPFLLKALRFSIARAPISSSALSSLQFISV